MFVNLGNGRAVDVRLWKREWGYEVELAGTTLGHVERSESYPDADDNPRRKMWRYWVDQRYHPEDTIGDHCYDRCIHPTREGAIICLCEQEIKDTGDQGRVRYADMRQVICPLS